VIEACIAQLEALVGTAAALPRIGAFPSDAAPASGTPGARPAGRAWHPGERAVRSGNRRAARAAALATFS